MRTPILITLAIFLVIATVAITLNSNKGSSGDSAVPVTVDMPTLAKLEELNKKLLTSEEDALKGYFEAAKKLEEGVMKSAEMSENASEVAQEAAKLASESAKKAAKAAVMSKSQKLALSELVKARELILEEEATAAKVADVDGATTADPDEGKPIVIREDDDTVEPDIVALVAKKPAPGVVEDACNSAAAIENTADNDENEPPVTEEQMMEAIRFYHKRDATEVLEGIDPEFIKKALESEGGSK